MLHAIASAAALGAADLFVKMAAGKVPTSLGTLIYGSVAFGVGLTWFLVDRARGTLQPASQSGVAYALGVGVAFSIVAVALYGAFRAGGPLSTWFRLSGLLVASVCGVVIWHEPVTARYIAGLGLTVIGVYLIVTP